MVRARVIAVAQTVPVPADVEANLAEHVALVELAAREGARVLVFPELSLTGYELEAAAELAFEERDGRLAPLVELAASTGMTLIVGAPVRAATGLHLGAFLVGPDGSLDHYAKRRLGTFPPEVNPGGPVPPPEPSVFVPGERDPDVRFDGHTAAVAICADTGTPAHARAAADRGARHYFACMFIHPMDLALEERRFEDYAARHRMLIAMANYGGPTGGLPAAGCSALWSEQGERLVQLPPRGSGIALVEERGAGWSARHLAR